MALSPLGRKHLLPTGKQKAIAIRISVNPAVVSNAVNGLALPRTPRGWKNYRKAQVAVARALGMKLEEAFSPYELGEVKQEQSVAA